MVSKLGLAILEARDQAFDAAHDHPTVERLTAAQRDVRSGLGFAKDAYSFGAFPNEAYSHTPRHAGAQQPGMTGQVKEDVIARLRELGVTIADGIAGLDPSRVAEGEWLTAPAHFRHLDPAGHWQETWVPEGHLAFSLCGVPVTYRRGGRQVSVERDDGTTEVTARTSLGADASAHLLGRTGGVRSIRVT